MLQTPSGGLTCQPAEQRKTSVIIMVKITELDPTSSGVTDTHNHHEQWSCFKLSRGSEVTIRAMHMGESELLPQRGKSDVSRAAQERRQQI